MQDIAIEERLERVEGSIAKVRKKNDAKQQGENAVGKDRLDAGREGDAGGCAGVGALPDLVRCDVTSRGLVFVPGRLTRPWLKAQPAMSASTVKSIMSTNTARDDAAAATKPPNVGPTIILTFENMAMAELMSLSSTGSSVR